MSTAGSMGPASEYCAPDGLLERPPALARSFDQIAADYEGRPGYPDEVFELLVEVGALDSGSSVLEIGSGTGQATIPMLDLGAHILAVEPGADLARHLQDRTSGRQISVVVSKFEDAVLREAAFDLVAAATAFHWVDAGIGPAKCATVLRDGGWLALWWTIWGDPDRADPFHEMLRPVLATKAPELLQPEAGYPAYLRDLSARVARVSATGAFGPISHRVLRWDGEHDPVGLRRLFATFAGWIALADPLRAELLDDVERIAREDFAGAVHRPYQTVLYLAQRRHR